MYCRAVDPYKIEGSAFDVLIVPVLSDNYAYVVVGAESGVSAVPPESSSLRAPPYRRQGV